MDERYREVLAINRAIAGAEAYEEILGLVVERTASFTSATACVLILSQDDGLARVARSVGVAPEAAAELALPLTERIDRELCRMLGFDRPDRFVAVPVIGKGGLMGILAVYGDADRDFDEELLSALADQAAIALDNARHASRLRASEEKLAAIISTAADAIISVDQAQHIVMYNEGAEKIFGWSRDEVLGQPLDILLPERFRASHEQHVEGFATALPRARKMGQRGSAIFGLRKDGEEFPADAAISRVQDGEAWVYSVVLRDVSEQARAEREQRFLAEVGPVLASSLDYDTTLSEVAEVAVRDIADLCIVEVPEDGNEPRRVEVASRDPSKAWLCELFEKTQRDLRHPHLLRSVLETQQPLLMRAPSAEAIASLAQNEEHHQALRAAEIHSVLGVPLVANGQLVGAMALVSSTPSRAFGRADVRLAEELARRAALSISSARLYRVARLATEARDDVLRVVAHDLRNPLNNIALQATLLRRMQAEAGSPSRKAAEVIERAAHRMNRLIQDLLDVARMESGRLSLLPAPWPAQQIVAEAIAAQAPLAASGSVEIRAEVAPDLPELSVDRDRLAQVFENLIGNALKFTEPGGHITVGAAPNEGDVLFWVRDTGLGIGEEDLPHLFDRFWQAAKTKRGGAGLGLQIAKGIIESHDGSIWVESTLGRGSTFFFRIPTKARGEQTRHDSGASESTVAP